MKKTLRELKTKRCFGFDRIPLIFLKDGASELGEQKEKKKTRSVESGKNLTFFKKGDKAKTENYRPISNLSSISRNSRKSKN